MQVKVFEAEEMATALKMVKETLGPDALILSTRTLRKGGLFGKPVLEVTAAVDAPPLAAATPSPTRREKSAIVASDGAEDELDYREIWRREEVDSRAARPAARFELPASPPAAPVSRPVEAPAAGAVASPELAALRGELDELKAMLRQSSRSEGERPSGFASLYRLAQKAPGGLQNLLAVLERCGIEAETAEKIAGCARERLGASELADPQAMQRFMREMVGTLVGVTGPLFPRQKQQQRVALVGATGVGKTTTLAKLAADYLNRVGGKMALVTIDTYRIAAAEQLKIYGEIMYLPVEVVFSPDELQAAFARHADKDLILVDTAGRSPRDEPSLEELSAFLGPDSGVRSHLVLAAPTGNRELQETVRRFGRLPLDSLIFTKLDECDDRGALVNVPLRHQLPISYLTNGQRVPEDLFVAHPATIADYVTAHA